MKETLTVTQLNDSIKALLEDAFGMLWVEGEVSNLRRPGSGHVYFTLKDDKSQIRAVFFRQFGVSRTRASAFELEDGMKILCRARLGAYVPRGEYQLIVESAEPLGAGALQKAFEQLKARLQAEGLFDAVHKKPLPYLPSRIGVVTSPTGAVIRDILQVTRRRFPSVDILLAPARVQGTEAARELIEALQHLQVYGGVDVIVIARGGGSLEDLAPFNDEGLAREIFRSAIPVVSAVGHETDFTICDFVADLRAPTPSAAAELILPIRAELIETVYDLRQRLVAAKRRYLDDQRQRLRGVKERFKDPRRFLRDYTQTLDDLRERLERAARQGLEARQSALKQLELRLANRTPAGSLREKTLRLGALQKDLTAAFHHYLDLRSKQVEKNAALLETLSPLSVLKRGYSITRRAGDGQIVKRASGLTLNERIAIDLADGRLWARVEQISGE